MDKHSFLRTATPFFLVGICMSRLMQPTVLQAQITSQSLTAGKKPQSDLQAIIRDAAARYQLPEAWITEVIRAESNGNARAVSPKGAKGLMQIMPGTWAYLQRKVRIGDNPFAVRDNVMAGSAYLRELYDRFGFPGCLAAYNAGPGRYQSYVEGRRSLPRETVNYVRIITSRLGRQLETLLGGNLISNKKAAALPAASSLFVLVSNAPDKQVDGQIADKVSASSLQESDLFVRRSSKAPNK